MRPVNAVRAHPGYAGNMSRLSLAVATAALAIFAAGAWAQPGGAPLDVRQAMSDGVNPAALAIWDVSNAAMDDDGALDPALLTPRDWATIEEAAQVLEAHSRRMAEAAVIVAGGPELVAGELPPGVASKEEIQAMIDADPDGFRAVAGDMADQAAALLAAARNRDAGAAGDLAFGIDGACQSCHVRYWYPRAE